MKKLLSTLVAGGLLFAAASAAGAATKPLWTDDAGDSGAQHSAVGQPVPGTDQAGFDLVAGSIVRKGADLEFSVASSAMPPFWTMPETVRFLWSFAVNGTSYRVTAKSFELGKPNPVNQSNMDQIGKVYADGFFRLEGECGVDASASSVSFIGCKTLGYIDGSFDTATKTFTFTVPMSEGAAICWLSHVAERSSDRSIIDKALWATTYKVPK
jgi:hypothetical protein